MVPAEEKVVNVETIRADGRRVVKGRVKAEMQSGRESIGPIEPGWSGNDSDLPSTVQHPDEGSKHDPDTPSTGFACSSFACGQSMLRSQ